MVRFELNRLASYDDDSLIAEMVRVAGLIKTDTITATAFDRYSKVSSSTIRRRFGGWQQALSQAGLAHRYGGVHVSQRMRTQCPRRYSEEEMISELQAVANKLGIRILTIEEFNKYGAIHGETIRRRFGSWGKALDRAGLEISSLGKRYSDDDYFENLLTVWTHYGRQPNYREMDLPPSRIPSGAYEAKWTTWRKALVAFVDRVNSDIESAGSLPDSAENERAQIVDRAQAGVEPSQVQKDGNARTIRLGLRYDVLRRDRFRCVLCGASPATDPGCNLHVDHIFPFSKGGQTVKENLRTLCSECNQGKGAKV